MATTLTGPATMNTVAVTSATVSSAVTVFSNLFTNNGVTLLNVALIVATVGGQTVLKKLTFSCPCAYPLNVFQSTLFFCGPSLVLFIIGVMLNTTTWRLVQGCCYRHPDTRHSIRTAVVYWIEVFVQSSVAPAAWLFVAFLDGTYYRCMLAANFCELDKAPLCANATVNQDIHEWDAMSGNGKFCPQCICQMGSTDQNFLESQSNVIAWSLLVAYGACAFFIICTVRMCDRYTLLQRKYVDTYKQEESNKFAEIAKEHASQIADNNARAFFSNKDWTKKDWDWVSGVSEISNPFFARIRMIESEKTQTTLYTPLQLWSAHNGYKILKPDVEAPSLFDDDEHPVNMN